MPLSRIDTAALKADAVDSTILDLTDDFAFTGSITGAGGGKLLKVQHYTSNTAVSGTTTVPYDNTVPLSTEGNSIMTATFDPVSASSSLIFLINVYGNENTNLADRVTYCLYDGTTFIGMGYQDATNHGNGNQWNQTSINLQYTPPNANSRTYTLRGAVNHGTFESLHNTTYITNPKYGSNVKNTITIFEVAA